MKALLAVLLTAAVVQFTVVALPPGNSDLISIQSLACDLSQHNPSLLYPGRGFEHNDAWIEHHESNLARLGAQGEPNWCFYPPIVPYLLTAIATVSPEIWRMVWGAIQFGLIALYAVVIRQVVIRVGFAVRPSALWILVLLIGSYPLARSVQLGQTSLLLAVLLWSGLLAAGRWAEIRAGLAVGAVVLVKPFLAAALIPALWQRAMRAPAIALLTVFASFAMSVLLIGWSAHCGYWDLLTTLSASQTAYYGNQSMMAGVIRWMTDWPVMDYGFQPEHGWVVASRVVALLIAAVAAVTQFRARNAAWPFSVGLWLAAALLALPISWEHHAVFLLPVIAVLWTMPLHSTGRVALSIATLLLAVAWLPLYADSGPGRLAASLPMLGTLIVFVLLVVIHVWPSASSAASGDRDVRS